VLALISDVANFLGKTERMSAASDGHARKLAQQDARIRELEDEFGHIKNTLSMIVNQLNGSGGDRKKIETASKRNRIIMPRDKSRLDTLRKRRKMTHGNEENEER